MIYKVPSIEFTPEGLATPEDRHRLTGALLDILVLLHWPVKQRPYIQRLLGFSWAHSSFASDTRVPALLVNNADFGNLAEYQQHNPLSHSLKRKLCWQVGTAVEFLHRCGIKHGDTKYEHVSLFRDPRENSMLPKLSDFASSVISQEAFLEFRPPGTIPWSSPEVRWQGRSGVSSEQADTYCYGLIVWRVFCEREDPLSRRFLTIDHGFRASLQDVQFHKAVLHRPNEAGLRFLMENDHIVERAKAMYSSLADVFEVTLRREPPQRSLSQAVIVIAKGQGYKHYFDAPTCQIQPFSISLFRLAVELTPCKYSSISGAHQRGHIS